MTLDLVTHVWNDFWRDSFKAMEVGFGRHS